PMDIMLYTIHMNLCVSPSASSKWPKYAIGSFILYSFIQKDVRVSVACVLRISMAAPPCVVHVAPTATTRCCMTIFDFALHYGCHAPLCMARSIVLRSVLQFSPR